MDIEKQFIITSSSSKRQKKADERMKSVLGNPKSGGLTKVLVEINSEIVDLTDKDEIE